MKMKKKNKELFTMMFEEFADTIRQVKRDQYIHAQEMEQMRTENEAFRKRIKSDMERHERVSNKEE